MTSPLPRFRGQHRRVPRIPPSLAFQATVAVTAGAGFLAIEGWATAWLHLGPMDPLGAVVAAAVAGLGAWYCASMAVDMARIARDWRRGR